MDVKSENSLRLKGRKRTSDLQDRMYSLQEEGLGVYDLNVSRKGRAGVSTCRSGVVWREGRI